MIRTFYFSGYFKRITTVKRNKTYNLIKIMSLGFDMFATHAARNVGLNDSYKIEIG